MFSFQHCGCSHVYYHILTNWNIYGPQNVVELSNIKVQQLDLKWFDHYSICFYSKQQGATMHLGWLLVPNNNYLVHVGH
jgi:hypothetical protein